MHARGEWDGVPRLTGLIEHPMLRPDFTILALPGCRSRDRTHPLDSSRMWELPMSRTTDRRPPNDEALLLALACGSTVEVAAQESSLSPRTVYRRLDDPAFRQRLSQYRADLVKRSSAMLTAAAM